jgi:anhydro-N-acetylmuramic acid kinase
MGLFKDDFGESGRITAIGLMSGTSLDGLDIVLCSFKKDDLRDFEIIDSTTVEYDNNLKERLQSAGSLSAYRFIELHREYGKWTGEQVIRFLKSHSLKVEIIASHGHTVFHEPTKNINFQIGDGAAIAATTGITTVSDFRSLDITLGGQGAPLIPIVDRDLFGEYDACINIGGFANISLDSDNERRAWDICPANTILNKLSTTFGMEYDKDGKIGKSGKVIDGLLNELEKLDYYEQLPPKSLGTEWLDSRVWPLINRYSGSKTENVMATLYEHVANRISSDLNRNGIKNALFTGGGVKNSYLISLIKERFCGKLIIPKEEIIDFKEALGFAYLGVLRTKGLPNCLSSVTGAKQNSSSGVIYHI